MFKVGDRVRITLDSEYAGSEGTIVLINKEFGDGLHYVVDVDGNDDYDPLIELITAIFNVPSSSVPFAYDHIELVDANA